MPKAKGEEGAPTSLPNTTPPSTGPDLTGWLFNATTGMQASVVKLETTIAALSAQLDRIETKITHIEGEVAGHAKWMHTLKVFAAVLAALLGWVFINAVWPWIKSKLGVP